jgi:hypothetical protein
VRHYLQYHNPERFGPVQIPQEGEPFKIMTRKKPDRLPGSWVWLISGEGRPRRYFLSKVFLVDRWQPAQDPDFFYVVMGSQGISFQPPLELTGYPWFEQMKHRFANFSLGLTEITHSYASYLLSLAQDLSPAYRQAIERGMKVETTHSRPGS